MVGIPLSVIELLNKSDFDGNDFTNLIHLLQHDPAAAQQMGTHNRSAIWVCCQHSDCFWRRQMAIPLLIRFGADVNWAASNGFTPLWSLYKAFNKSGHEHKRKAAFLLVEECGASLPVQQGDADDVLEWLRERPSIVHPPA
jgi:hypothetical protein